jgi:hypothetical protein
MNKEELYTDIITKLEVEYPGAIPIFITVAGSHSHGTNTIDSDVDFRGVFIKPKVDFYSDSDRNDAIFDNNNSSFWELSKLIKYLINNNPSGLELINTTSDCVIYQHPCMDEIINRRDEYLSKICLHTFTAYAHKQNVKASGKDKKNNWEKNRTIRKTPLDFCYLLQVNKSVMINDYVNSNGLKLEHFGLCKQPHSHNTYSIFYDYEESNHFRGISFEKSNDVHLSSIPKDIVESSFIGHMSFNKDGYSKHCNDYKEYLEYLSKRNDQRWVQVANSESKIDGKNMCHTQRLIDVGTEIGLGLGIIMKRPNRDQLLAIKRGECDLQSLLEKSQQLMANMKEIYRVSLLPDRPSKEIVAFLNNSLTQIRFKIYD